MNAQPCSFEHETLRKELGTTIRNWSTIVATVLGVLILLIGWVGNSFLAGDRLKNSVDRRDYSTFLEQNRLEHVAFRVAIIELKETNKELNQEIKELNKNLIRFNH